MRFVKVFLGLGLVAALVFAVVQPVHADPHAVFWTVVGQQQLFFNVLAALNQADYVESLQLRQQLAQKRDAANYAPSSAAALRETQTDLADILTRDITLEGQDVRTQERSDDYAREVVRQRQLATAIEKLCREAFGSENCQLKREEILDPQQASQILKQRERAFISDPLALGKIPTENGALAALDSGTEAYQEKAKKTLEDAQKGGAVLPLAYSPEIAELRLKLEGDTSGNASAALQLFNKIIDKAKAKFQPAPFDVNVWLQNLKPATVRTSSDEVEFQPSSPSASNDQQIAEHARAVAAALILDDLNSIAESAQDRVTSQLFATVVDNAIPDRAQVPKAGISTEKESDEYGEIRIVDTAPANVKVGLQQGLNPLLLQILANPAFIDPSQVDNPAGESAVDRQGKGPLKIGTPLESFEKADVIEEGLYWQSGVTPKAGLNFNFLQAAIPEIIQNLRP